MAIPKSVGFPAMAFAAVALLVPSPVFAQAPVRVGGDIKPPVRTEYVAPVYPLIAQQARVEGVVILELLIGTDGSVRQARLLRQSALLDGAAVEAAKKWRYTPTLLNGTPTEVLTTVTVTFNLSRSMQPAVIVDAAEMVQPPALPVSAPADPKVIVVPAGYAIVDVTVGKDGTVREAKLIKGDEKLAAAALDAVRQWRYPPTLLNGVPIEVKMTVLVPIKAPGL